jgi:flagellar motor switch protein FliN/FliY
MADDLLKPEEIEALLKAAGAGDDSKASGRDPADGGLNAGAMSALAAARAGQSPSGGPQPKSPTERLLEQAQAGLAAAVSPNLQGHTGIPPELGAASAFQFQAFDTGHAAGDGVSLNALQDVELDLRIELGRTELLIEEVLQLKSGSVVPLDKLAGDPVDILVNGRLVARGEVLVLNDNFCVRVAEIVAPAL